jgi:hypothetical protein
MMVLKPDPVQYVISFGAEPKSKSGPVGSPAKAGGQFGPPKAQATFQSSLPGV